jgi:phosphoenolpyruvate-protein phosphotransferase
MAADPIPVRQARPDPAERLELVGRAGAPGRAVGRVYRPVVGTRAPTAADEVGALPDVASTRTPDDEAQRLRAALHDAAEALESLAVSAGERAGADVGAIFEAQALFARDPGLVEPALAAIADGARAEDAVERVAASLSDQLAGIDDDYFRARAADVRDVARRVVGSLTGRGAPALHRRDGAPAVIVADDLDPSLVAGLRLELVAGLALGGGAPTGHTAIVARALGLPLVLGLGDAVDAVPDDVESLIDGTLGRIILRPTDADRAALARADTRVVDHAVGSRVTGLAATVAVEANVGSVREAAEAARVGAAGIGLVRTELLFFGRSAPPGLDEQRSLYRRIAEPFPSAPVVFRTLDIGGDKPAPWSTEPAEVNPALGVRGVRLGLREPELLRTQLRALLEASAGRTLDVMLPMVSSLEDVAAARAVLAAALAEALATGAAVAADVRLGIMVEVPAVAVLADAFAPAVDFLSIGTNDLTQYTLAADRTHAALADLASPLQPAVLRLVAGVVGAAKRAGRPVAVCGEAAADPYAGPVLAGLGVGILSVTPTAVRQVADRLAATPRDLAEAVAAAAVSAGSLTEVRERVRALDAT